MACSLIPEFRIRPFRQWRFWEVCCGTEFGGLWDDVGDHDTIARSKDVPSAWTHHAARHLVIMFVIIASIDTIIVSFLLTNIYH